MLRNKIEKATGLTRKAINYYEEKGLISPHKDENGYRIYSKDDLDRLKKISILRKLGLSVGDIKEVLSNSNGGLSSILRRREVHLENEKIKKEILEDIVRGEDEKKISKKLEVLENKETIYEKLERAFPGYFGLLFFASYRPFLDEPVADKKAFGSFISYLDSLPELRLTREEITYLQKASADYGMEDLDEINKNKLEAISNVEDFLNDNEEIIRAYEDYKNSEAYKNSPMASINDKLKSYMVENNYYETAIPLIRKFSKSYDDYYKKLLEADKTYRDLKDKN